MPTPEERGPSPRPASPLQVLVIDDDRSLRDGCAAMLGADGHRVMVEGRGDDACDLVRRRRFDVVLLDLFMTPVSGMEILATIRRTAPETLVVIMTGEPSVETNIEALEAGAWEYIPKPFAATQLRMVVGRAAHVLATRGQSGTTPGEQARLPVPEGLGVILGVSPAFQRALSLARKVAATDASVLIVGESGTGKEMIAQFIHAHSRRAQHEMVPVNCAALPEALLESEMFGHRRGSFTGADREKPGLFETAHDGTLFLDELTEMSPAIQAKLLRVLQDGKLRRVGSEREEERPVDVRIISATNVDPQQAVRDGRLRRDLFFRLWVFPIHLPPLRERPDDVAHLARHFLAYYWTKHRGASDAPPELGPEAMEYLLTRSWPGNVRELQNAMERISVSVEPGQRVVPWDIAADEVQLGPTIGSSARPAPALAASAAGPAPAPASAPATVSTVAPASSAAGTGTTALPTAALLPDPSSPALLTRAFHSAKEELLTGFERSYLERLVQRADFNLARAARLASIDRTTLYRLLEKHGLQRSDFGDPSA